eukprot:gnl/MRDRNA2_/MRDRNA2_82760_c0_seq2.p1 gnl/MRDRNA2_/MRDRNA2_82760_c0~~gnl/MRDRNA2_/MRDRNA2_82760_c0_seq2.p1  ORF type:complete len:412 (-),score=76.74 gnl/MRDRNA2_/MRDRNA2_82760_c0_seq2:235-1470(-)
MKSMVSSGTSGKMGKALVVGNGIIGLTTATELLDQGFEVLVVSAAKAPFPSDASASDLGGLEWASGIAGGVSLPWHIEPADKAISWNLTTLKMYHAQVSSSLQSNSPFKGLIELIPVVMPFVAADTAFSKETPDWAKGEFGEYYRFERLSAADVNARLSRYNFQMPPGYQSAWLIYTTCCNGVPYMAYLTKELSSRQVQIRYGVVFQSQEEVCEYAIAEECSCVVNCAGVGAGVLNGEPSSVHPARGTLVGFQRASSAYEGDISKQSVMVLAEEGQVPGLDGMEPYTLTAELPGYVIPRGKFIVAGGTYADNDSNRTVSKEEQTRMQCIAKAFMPELPRNDKGLPQQLFSVAGLRPASANGVRCEFAVKGDGLVWCNNYGHGGSGWGLGWGCARELAGSLAKHFSRGLARL